MSEKTEPDLKFETNGYEKSFYYTIEVKDQEITPLLKEMNTQIKSLEGERNKLINKLVDKARLDAPRGWEVKLAKTCDYGYIDCKIIKVVYEIDKPKPAAEPYKPPELSKLQKLLQTIDAKTLLNSGVLTREEKREILGLDKLDVEFGAGTSEALDRYREAKKNAPAPKLIMRDE